MRWRAALAVLLLAASAVLLSGCAEQAGVQNRTNHFQYGGQATGKDGMESYTWRNTMGGAQFQWGGQAASGSLAVTVRDAGGSTVFTQTLSGTSQQGSVQDFTGRPGDWTIQLEFRSFTGQMGLNLNAKGPL